MNGDLDWFLMKLFFAFERKLMKEKWRYFICRCFRVTKTQLTGSLEILSFVKYELHVKTWKYCDEGLIIDPNMKCRSGKYICFLSNFKIWNWFFGKYILNFNFNCFVFIATRPSHHHSKVVRKPFRLGIKYKSFGEIRTKWLYSRQGGAFSVTFIVF